LIGPHDKNKVCGYWLPNPFCSPHSGQCQKMPLQDMPQTFSYMQSWQMAKPQRQVQQKGAVFPQRWQLRFLIRALRFSLTRLRREVSADCFILYGLRPDDSIARSQLRRGEIHDKSKVLF
jgi:hypothetical protein